MNGGHNVMVFLQPPGLGRTALVKITVHHYKKIKGIVQLP